MLRHACTAKERICMEEIGRSVLPSGGRLPDAVRPFQGKTDHKCMREPRHSIKRWVKCFEESRAMIHDAPRSGRPRKLSEKQATAAAKHFEKCSQPKDCNEHAKSRSIQEALDRSPALRRTQKKSGATNKTLQRHIRKCK